MNLHLDGDGRSREADQATQQRREREMAIEWIFRIATHASLPFPSRPLSSLGYLLSPFVFPQLFCFARYELGGEGGGGCDVDGPALRDVTLGRPRLPLLPALYGV